MREAVELEKTYTPSAVEGDTYKKWLDNACFSSTPDDRPREQRFTIVIPPPNVTGALHLGHALNNTLQDILIRWHRMMGHNTLWLPGTDHAGIATQAVVEERLLKDEGKNRHDIGREALVKRIWDWKDQYEKRILSQLQLIGCSCDWSRKRFTLDDGLAAAVRHTFFKFFKEGLIFRGKRLVNWDTQLHTAVADDEVYHEKVKGHFWHFKYPVKDPQAGEPEFVVIATTRPETMLGDTAVAVHPDPAGYLDREEANLNNKLAEASNKEKPEIQAQIETLQKRRKEHLPLLVKLSEMAKAGRTLILPLMEREIPLVADIWADPLKGSGCVKITPAHDPNDYEVGQRCDLPMINILTEDGKTNENGGAYTGLTFPETRKKVVADMEERGLLVEIEDKETEIGHSHRSKTPIEPYLSDQWFVKMGDLAQGAMDAVSDGRVKFHPDRYAKTYLDWLGEKRDWCISRQLWWGHRIPIWYCDTCSKEEIDAALGGNDSIWYAFDEEKNQWLICSQSEDLVADAIAGHTLCQDEDVLDTWFSSALWPYSTLGWPEKTKDLEYYYPGSVLITSRDIITNWVARMVLTGLYNMGEIPFDHVYIHAKILDGRGDTMSKSKGNGVDPVDIVSVYGADALRYSIADMATDTQDVRMPVDYICPHCGHLIPQTTVVPNNQLPKDVNRVTCSKCKERFATQWAPDKLKEEMPVARETSEKFEIGRNFCNKLWNSARFTFMNLENTPFETIDVTALPPEDRWILAKLSATIEGCHRSLTQYHYSTAIKLARDFFWDSFCDWYIELTKPRLYGEGDAGSTKQILAFIMDQILRLLSPFMPFVTERLWEELNRMAPRRGLPGVAEIAESEILMLAEYPPTEGWPKFSNPEILNSFEQIQEAVRGIRDLRNQCSVPPKNMVTVTIKADQQQLDLLDSQKHILQAMANVETLNLVTEADRPKNAGTTVVGPMQIFVHDISDDAAECKRIEKELVSIEKRLAGVKGKLANEKFVNNAKLEVVETERQRLTELEESYQAAKESLADLQG